MYSLSAPTYAAALEQLPFNAIVDMIVEEEGITTLHFHIAGQLRGELYD